MKPLQTRITKESANAQPTYPNASAEKFIGIENAHTSLPPVRQKGWKPDLEIQTKFDATDKSQKAKMKKAADSVAKRKLNVRKRSKRKSQLTTRNLVHQINRPHLWSIDFQQPSEQATSPSMP